MDPPPRETWATRVGFVLAAVGSAVGLGNVWRFPFVVGEEGGAAFLLVYIGFILLIGLPAILVELVLGRSTALNPVGALESFGGTTWRYIGGLFVFTGIVLLSFYTVAAGWALRYTGASLTGAYESDPAGYFVTISEGWAAVGFQLLFVLIVVAVVTIGVRQGIELAVTIMVPGIVVLLLGLAVYAATLPDATAGYQFYLDPDVDYFVANWATVIPAAAGQAFFTLSLGMGVMITYASYLETDRDLMVDGCAIVGLDTLVAIVVGFVVFPILAVAAVDPADPGPGAVFISLAQAFADLQFGWLLGFLFFLVLSLAALSSAISLLEVGVAYLIDEWEIGRPVAAGALGGTVFVLGIPTALDQELLTLYDSFAAEVLLVLGGLLLVILVGWQAHERALAELQSGRTRMFGLGRLWIWTVRGPVLIGLLVAFVLALAGFWTDLQTVLGR